MKKRILPSVLLCVLFAAIAALSACLDEDESISDDVEFELVEFDPRAYVLIYEWSVPGSEAVRPPTANAKYFGPLDRDRSNDRSSARADDRSSDRADDRAATAADSKSVAASDRIGGIDPRATSSRARERSAGDSAARRNRPDPVSSDIKPDELWEHANLYNLPIRVEGTTYERAANQRDNTRRIPRYPILVKGVRVEGKGEDIDIPARAKLAMERMDDDEFSMRIRLCLDETGTPTEARVEKSSGYTRADAAVKREVMTWQYLPYHVDGSPVPFCELIRFKYALQP